jgi:hypothetical protein
MSGARDTPASQSARGDATWKTWFASNFVGYGRTTHGAHALVIAEELMTAMGFARPQMAVDLRYDDVYREYESQLKNDVPLCLVLKAACTMDKGVGRTAEHRQPRTRTHLFKKNKKKEDAQHRRKGSAHNDGISRQT